VTRKETTTGGPAPSYGGGGGIDLTIPPEEYQEGGIVPGPIGRPRVAIVHGGETVLPTGGGLSSQPIIIRIPVQLDGRTIAEVQIPHLQRFIDDRRIRVQ